MGRPRPAPPVILLIGLLSADADLLRRARQKITRRYGPPDLESALWPFDQTDYYTDEMGSDLQRQFVTLQRLMRPEDLPDVKLEANRIEQEIAEECAALLDVARPVNIDPGYLDLGKLVLATTKDRAHRIYLDKGIYAEVTLQFANGAWQVTPWTYPDYHQPEYHAFFTRARDRLRELRMAAGLDDPDPRGDSR
jgi:hypothetical protein